MTIRSVSLQIAPVVLLAGLLGPHAVAQSPEFVAAPVDTMSRVVAHRDRIEVKLVEGSGAFLDADGRLGSRSGVDVTTVARLFAQADHAEPLVALPFELLDAWHRQADRVLPAGATRPGHMALWFRLRCADPARAADLCVQLRRAPWVQDAYFEPIPLPCSVRSAAHAVTCGGDDIPPPTPDFTSYQTYKAPAPDGLGFDSGRSIYGAKGAGIRVYHCENDWVWTHEDLDLSEANFIGGVTSGTTSGADHGTGVVGILAARDDGSGMTGVANDVEIRLIDTIQNGVAQSVLMSAADGMPGDIVILIGTYNLQMVKPRDEVPYEYFQSNFDAVRTATAIGLIVLESAGNGDNDMDDPRFSGRFDLSVRDSGALMIGATDGSARVRAPFSNYGSRIDANGWGYDVATCGYGTLFSPNGDRRQRYTEAYAGTSSATALLSGVVASLAGAIRQQLGRTLLPSEARALLRNHGTTVTGDISRRADLVALLRAVGLPDGLALDRAVVPPTGVVAVAMTGPIGGSYGLVLAFGPGSLPLGLNRPLLLDPATLVALGSFPLVGGQAQTTMTIPNDPSLSGVQLFVQGAAFDPGSATLRLTSSAEFGIR